MKQRLLTTVVATLGLSAAAVSTPARAQEPAPGGESEKARDEKDSGGEAAPGQPGAEAPPDDPAQQPPEEPKSDAREPSETERQPSEAAEPVPSSPRTDAPPSGSAGRPNAPPGQADAAPASAPARPRAQPRASGAAAPATGSAPAAAQAPAVEAPPRRYTVLREPGADELRDRPAPPRGPIEQPFHVRLNIDVSWNSNTSFDLFANNDVATNVGLSAGYAIPLVSRISLLPEIGWSTDQQSSSGLFGGALQDADLRTHDVYASATLRYGLLGFLEPHARLAGGLSFVNVDLTFAQDDASFDTRSTEGFGTLGAGFTVKTPDRAMQTSSGRLSSLQFGLLVEGGYRLASETELGLEGSDADDLRVSVTAPTLGNLETSAPYLRIALGGRF